jgi:VanZ family protein
MRFDRYMHALGSFSYGLLIYFTLAALIPGSLSPVWAAILTGALGETFGVLIEHFEFAADVHGKSPTRHQKGLRDTNFDLIANTIGSILAGVYAYLTLAAS